MDEVQQNAEGVNFDLTIVDETGTEVDVSVATSRLLFFRKPSGVTVQKTAAHVGGGKIRYSSTTGDLDEVGIWSWSGKVVLGGFAKPTSVNQFRVKPSLG
jgi:hypothetical protein